MELSKLKEILIGVTVFGTSLFTTPAPTSLPNHTILESQRHEKFNYPIINDQKVPAVSYLTLPFRKSDLEKFPLNKNTLYDVAEGWVYSLDELKIDHGQSLHAAVDFGASYGVPVVAPADGYAMASYHTEPLKDDQGIQTFYLGKQVNLGLGYFVRIYVPTVDRYIELAHLSDIDPSIPFSVPEKTDNGWKPTNQDFIGDIATDSHFVYVKRGTVLGYLGYSGLTWGYEDYTEGAQRPVVIDPKKYQSWDEPHVHLEEFWVDKNAKIIGWQRDPYGIYDSYQYYPTSDRKGTMGKDPLFFLNGNGLPKFADEM